MTKLLKANKLIKSNIDAIFVIFIFFYIIMNISIELLNNPLIQFNIVLCIIGIYLTFKNKKRNYKFLLLPIFVFIINEILFNLFNIDLYRGDLRTRLFYDLPSFTGDNYAYVDDNFSEGYYKNEKCLSSNVAEYKKFDKFISLLDIKKGDSVLDLGCGNGNLINYLGKKGIYAVGVTISESQYKYNLSKKNNVVLGDYTKFNKKLVNNFDFVISTGSLEHIGNGNPKFMSVYQNKVNKCGKLFSMVKKYFKENSPHKKILLSTLHINPRFKNRKELYIIERAYGGSFFLDQKGYSQKNCLTKNGYKVDYNGDYTKHYYIPSYCDKSHFGNPFPGTEKFLPYCLAYPNAVYIILYHMYGLWMWMFDNKYHKPRDFECPKNKDKCDLSFQENKIIRPITLYWTIGKLD
jgi:SAM-dependent methyltransferase